MGSKWAFGPRLRFRSVGLGVACRVGGVRLPGRAEAGRPWVGRRYSRGWTGRRQRGRWDRGEVWCGRRVAAEPVCGGAGVVAGGDARLRGWPGEALRRRDWRDGVGGVDWCAPNGALLVSMCAMQGFDLSGVAGRGRCAVGGVAWSPLARLPWHPSTGARAVAARVAGGWGDGRGLRG